MADHKRCLSRAVPFALLFLIASCSGDDGAIPAPPPPTTPPVTSTTPCQADGDCLQDQFCNKASGMCEAKPKTPSDVATDKPPYADGHACDPALAGGDCASGYCSEQNGCAAKPSPVAECKADADCSKDEVCNAAAGKCEAKAPPAPLACADGEVIINDRCISDDFVVEFPDAKLREAIIAELKITGDKIRFGDLKKLEELSLYDSDVGDLTGMEYCVSLAWLYLFGNERIVEVSPLWGLKKLKVLYLHNQKIATESIAKITNLTTLSLSYTADIAKLVVLPSLIDLIVLDIADGTSLDPLADLINLKKLSLWHVGIAGLTDIGSKLEKLAELHYLNLNGNGIVEIKSLASLNNLTELHLFNNKITDITPLAGFTKLSRLDLSSNRIGFLGPLAKIHNNGGLQSGSWVNLKGNPIMSGAWNTNLAIIRMLENSGVTIYY